MGFASSAWYKSRFSKSPSITDLLDGTTTAQHLATMPKKSR